MTDPSRYGARWTRRQLDEITALVEALVLAVKDARQEEERLWDRGYADSSRVCRGQGQGLAMAVMMIRDTLLSENNL